MSLNKVMLIGHLGADPETRTTTAGGKVVTFRLATSEQWKDKASGAKRERTEWHSIVVFNPALADIVEKYLRKGSKAYVEGQLQTRKWQDSQGQDRWSTEIVLQNFGGAIDLLDRRPADPGRHDYSGHDRSAASASGAASGGGRAGAVDDLDDDVPF